MVSQVAANVSANLISDKLGNLGQTDICCEEHCEALPLWEDVHVIQLFKDSYYSEKERVSKLDTLSFCCYAHLQGFVRESPQAVS